MNIGPLGFAGSIASTRQVQGKGSSDVQASQDAADAQARKTSTDIKAEKAAGIGETQEDANAQDRDADGRRIWEIDEQEAETGSEEETLDQNGSKENDATGKLGKRLDLSG
ncbi:MAG: hypothetical protein MPJ24_00595 [Pirellulaceae bacterium]|nr:hypothetical protein [Pirellulaceae bacterium]